MKITHAIQSLIHEHGHAAVAQELAACVGWQARWYPQNQAERIGRATQLLTEAWEILRRLEEEDARQSKSQKSQDAALSDSVAPVV